MIANKTTGDEEKEGDEMKLCRRHKRSKRENEGRRGKWWKNEGGNRRELQL